MIGYDEVRPDADWLQLRCVTQWLDDAGEAEESSRLNEAS